MFAILGLHKHKDRGALQKRASHHLRAHFVPNADPTKGALNGASWTGTPDALVDEIWRRTGPAMQRKDGVRVVELMLTASPEWFSTNHPTRLKELSTGALEFISETFGRANIVAMGMHRDEKSPHVWAFVTPIVNGKLRASQWLDGPKKMQKLHTDWAAKMAPAGLIRGAHKSGAKHIDIRTYYSAVNGSENAQERISREMSRRAGRAKKRAEEAESRLTELEARESQAKRIFNTLSEVQQNEAARRFASAQAPTPLDAQIKPIRDSVWPLQRPSPSTRSALRPS